MMFGESKENIFVKNWLEPFYNLVKITGFSYKTSKSDKVQFSFEIEGKPEEEGFKGKDRLDGTVAKGKLGSCKVGIYMDAATNKHVRALVESFAKLGIKTGTIKEMNDKVFTKAFVPSEDGFEYQLKTQTNEFMIKVFTSLADILIKSEKFVWIATTARLYQEKYYMDSLKCISSKLTSGEKIMACFVQAEEDVVGLPISTPEGVNTQIEYKSEGKNKWSEEAKFDNKWWVDGLEDKSDFDSATDLASLSDLSDLPEFLQ